MNSGKVRLNSGILERRHSRWGKALHHFRMARQIDDTYCEPDYWIGATLLQQGSNLDLALLVGSPFSLFASWESMTPPLPLLPLLPSSCPPPVYPTLSTPTYSSALCPPFWLLWRSPSLSMLYTPV